MKSRSHQHIGLAAAACAALAMAVPAQAQFGGFGRVINDARRAAESQNQEQPQQTPDECQQSGSNSVGGSILGGILGRTANDAASRAGLGSFLPVSEFSDQISNAIACRLDPDEQKQMADATIEATRGTAADGGAQVGATSTWVSETRPGVSGRSTVTGRETAPGQQGRDCITVTDIIIVDGEETRDDKQMCRVPPSPRYAIAAA